MTTFLIDDCVKKINEALAKEGLPETMNARLLRHYTQLEGMPKPLKQGKYAVYQQAHIDAVLELRRSQSVGITSKAYSYVSEARTASLKNDSALLLSDAFMSSSSAFASSTSPEAMLPALNVASSHRTPDQNRALMALAQLDTPSIRNPQFLSKSFQVAAGRGAPVTIGSIGASLTTSAAPVPMSTSVPQHAWHEVECMDGVRLHIRNDVAKAWSDIHKEAIAQTTLTLNPDTFKEKP